MENEPCGAEGTNRAGALRAPSTVADLAQRYQVHPSHIDAWTMQLQAQAARVFTPGAGGDGKAAREREIERLRARIGELPVERDFLARRTGK